MSYNVSSWIYRHLSENKELLQHLTEDLQNDEPYVRTWVSENLEQWLSRAAECNTTCTSSHTEITDTIIRVFRGHLVP